MDPDNRASDQATADIPPKAKSRFGACVEQFVSQAVAIAADGLSIADASRLFVALIQTCVKAAMGFSAPGVAKKRLVLDAVGELYDAIGPAIPLPSVLSPVRKFLRPYLRRFVVAAADGAIEAVYSSVK